MDANSVAMVITIVVAVLGSSLTTIRLMLRQMNNLEARLTARFDRFEENVTAQFKDVAGQFKDADENVAAQFKDVAGQFKDADEKVTAQFKDVAGQFKDADEKVAAQFKDADEKVTDRIDRLDDKVTGRIDRLDDKVTDIGERLARVEGHLMAPEGFTLRRHPSQGTGTQVPDDPAADHREAG